MARKQRGLSGWQTVLLGLSWPAGVLAQPWVEPGTLPVAPSPHRFASAQGQVQVHESAVPWRPTQKTVADVEILHGNQRVWPPPTPRPLPLLIVPVVVPQESSSPEKTAPRTDAEKAAPQTCKEEVKPAVVESRTIILAPHAGVIAPVGEPLASTAPWLCSSASAVASPFSGGYSVPWTLAPIVPSYPASTPPAQPQVIVLKDRDSDTHTSPNSSISSLDQVRGITLSHELLLGLSGGIVGLGVGAWVWRRRKAVPSSRGMHPLPYVPLGGDGVLLMGRYNAGPRPATAEKFEIGPSYAVMREEKKKIEAQNQQALVEFILGQNVALHAEVFGSATDSLPLAEECHEVECPSGQTEKISAMPLSQSGL